MTKQWWQYTPDEGRILHIFTVSYRVHVKRADRWIMNIQTVLATDITGAGQQISNLLQSQIDLGAPTLFDQYEITSVSKEYVR